MNSISSSSSETSPSKYRDLQLPITRVKMIMKSSPEVEAISQDCLYLVTKATEMFLKHWTKQAHAKFNKRGMLEYKHLAEVVQTSNNFRFMCEVVPRKITYRQFKEMMAVKKKKLDSNSSDDDDSIVDDIDDHGSKNNHVTIDCSSDSESNNTDSSEKSNISHSN